MAMLRGCGWLLLLLRGVRKTYLSSFSKLTKVSRLNLCIQSTLKLSIYLIFVKSPFRSSYKPSYNFSLTVHCIILKHTFECGNSDYALIAIKFRNVVMAGRLCKMQSPFPCQWRGMSFGLRAL